MKRITDTEAEWRELAGLGAVTPERLWRAKRLGISDAPPRRARRRARRRRCARTGSALGMRAGVQGGRHLRRRVRRADAVLLLDLRRGERGGRRRRQAHPDPGLGPEPDRAGHRVRLLLRAGGRGAQGGGLRGRARQLEPRDGVDRLRHLDPALLRAADVRGRDERGRGREAARRDRPARRADAAQARARAARGGRAAARHAASTNIDRAENRRTLRRAGRRARACCSPRARTATQRRRGGRTPPSAWASRCWCARATCSAGAACASSTAPASSRPCWRRASRSRDEAPLLLDKFLEDAIEVDVDALGDGDELRRRRGDGAHRGGRHPLGRLVLRDPAVRARRRPRARASRRSRSQLARALEVKGLLNVQFAVKGERVYILEANPRASRTVPFVRQGDRLAARAPGRARRGRQDARRDRRDQGAEPTFVSIKKPVLPFARFPGEDALLGPEMKSTGEVMGRDSDFGRAFAKAQLGSGEGLPTSGAVFLSVSDDDKRSIIFMAKRLADLGFTLLATRGTARFLKLQRPASARSCSRCTRASPTSSTASPRARSRWSSTRRSAASRSTTSGRSAPPRCATACRP